MLKKIDRYIIQKFLSTFFFTVLIFVLIAVFIDFSEKVEKFVESEATRSQIAFEYYPNFILFIVGMLWPLFALIAVVYFTGRLAGNNEILSMLNAGMSFNRLLRPYLIAATFLTVLHLAGTHYFIPRGNLARLNLEYTYFEHDKDKGKKRNVHMFLSPDTKVYINFWRKRDSTARDLRLERYADNQLVYMLKARTAEWVEEPDKWRFRNYEIRTFDGREETLEVGRGEQMDTTMALHPNDFVDYQEQQTMLTTPSLLSYLRKQKERGVGNTQKYQIELQRRTAEPITIFILTIIGLAVAGRKVRGGMGIQLAIGIGLGALFVFMSRFAAVFAAGNAMPISIGMWMPNIVFGIVAIYLVRIAPK